MPTKTEHPKISHQEKKQGWLYTLNEGNNGRM